MITTIRTSKDKKWGTPTEFMTSYDPERRVLLVIYNGTEYEYDIRALDRQYRKWKKQNVT